MYKDNLSNELISLFVCFYLISMKNITEIIKIGFLDNGFMWQLTFSSSWCINFKFSYHLKQFQIIFKYKQNLYSFILNHVLPMLRKSQQAHSQSVHAQ